MHYFHFNIGDYAGSTVQLNWLESEAYHRLLKQYYLREGPLPADLAATCRLLGARTKAQKDAVHRVLEEYFTPTDAGWWQRRCEDEIAQADVRSRRAAAGGRGRASTRKDPRPVPGSQPGAGEDDACAVALASVGAASSARAMAQADPQLVPGTVQARVKHEASNAPSPNPSPNPNPNPNPNPTNPSPNLNPNPPRAHAAYAPGVAPPDPPIAVGDWCNFFAREGYDAGVMMRNATLRAAMGEWVARGVDQGLMREAMALARARLGEAPKSPNYLAHLIDELRPRRAAPAAAAKPRPPVEKI